MSLGRAILRVLPGMMAFISLSSPLHADEKIKSRMVYCDKGQDPADVLSRELGPQALEITLVGTCPGFSVTRNDVRIEGDDENGCPATTASVDGTIRFEGVQRAVIACLQVTGSGIGVDAGFGSSVLIIDSSISGNIEEGVIASNGATISISRSSVMNNGWTGVVLNTNAIASIDNTEIGGNGSVSGTGDLSLSLHSTVTGGGATIGATHLQFDSGAVLDGPSIGPVSCADDESSALVNGTVPAGCTGF